MFHSRAATASPQEIHLHLFSVVIYIISTFYFAISREYIIDYKNFHFMCKLVYKIKTVNKNTNPKDQSMDGE